MIFRGHDSFQGGVTGGQIFSTINCVGKSSIWLRSWKTRFSQLLTPANLTPGIIFVSCILSIERKKPLNHNLLIGAGSLNKYKNNTWATKKTFLLSIIITGCFIGILRMIYDIYNPQSPRNWVVFPPLYTPNKQEPFFLCSIFFASYGYGLRDKGVQPFARPSIIFFSLNLWTRSMGETKGDHKSSIQRRKKKHWCPFLRPSQKSRGNHFEESYHLSTCDPARITALWLTS